MARDLCTRHPTRIVIVRSADRLKLMSPSSTEQRHRGSIVAMEESRNEDRYLNSKMSRKPMFFGVYNVHGLPTLFPSLMLFGSCVREWQDC